MPNLDFDMPQNQSSSIKVIGIGGGGSNAVNYMYHKGIKGVRSEEHTSELQSR